MEKVKMDFNLKCIDDNILNTLNQTIPFPVLIFNQEGPLYFDEKVKELLCNENYNVSYIDIYHNFHDAYKPRHIELILLNPTLSCSPAFCSQIYLTSVVYLLIVFTS